VSTIDTRAIPRHQRVDDPTEMSNLTGRIQVERRLGTPQGSVALTNRAILRHHLMGCR